ncbi:MAG: hypothetical protein JNM67_01100 [Bacteroidetes bacterium]|nr:hypothetical protein [Bacteroidota bacterium]
MFLCCSKNKHKTSSSYSIITTYSLSKDKFKYAEELFDSLGRSIEYKTYYEGSNQIRFISKTYYDSLNRIYLINKVWFTKNKLPNSSWIKFKYNVQGQLCDRSTLLGDDTFHNLYEYNSNGKIKTEFVISNSTTLWSGKIIYYYNSLNCISKKEFYNEDDGELKSIDTFIYSSNLITYIDMDSERNIRGKTDSLFNKDKLIKVTKFDNTSYPENVNFVIQDETQYKYYGKKLISEFTRHRASNACIPGDSVFYEKLMYIYK